MRVIHGGELKEILAKHERWLENAENGESANLREADLSEANIDYACWPLCCGSFGAMVRKRIAAQLAYHFCRLVCDDAEVIAAQKALLPLANQFHRVTECGRLPLPDEGKE